MRIDALLLDVDGVLTQGNAAIPGAPEALHMLVERGVPFRIVTNTSQRSRATLAQRLSSFGFSVDPATIFSPSVAAARYLIDQGKTAYLAVREDARADFRALGVALDDRAPDVVVLGDLGDDLSYAELNRVLRFLLGGAELIALGGTRYWHAADGPALDVGSFTALFEHATGARARVLGKPDPSIFVEAAHALGVRLDDLAMIGDDAEVDVAAAKRAGLGAGILVQTGKYRPGDEARHAPPPDAVYPSFPSFAAAFLESRR